MDMDLALRPAARKFASERHIRHILAGDWVALVG